MQPVGIEGSFLRHIKEKWKLLLIISAILITLNIISRDFFNTVLMPLLMLGPLTYRVFVDSKRYLCIPCHRLLLPNALSCPRCGESVPEQTPFT